MRVNFKSIWRVLKDTSKGWIDSDPFRESAVISYYAIFSIPGLLIIVIWVAGIFFGQEAVRGEIGSQVGDMMGPTAAEGVESLIKSAALDQSSMIMKIIGIGTLVFGATTLFFQLQKSLNNIWDVQPVPESNFRKFLYDRAYSLGLIMVIAFLLLITLVLSALISVVSTWIERNFGEYLLYLVQVVNFILALGIVTCLFAIMFKVLPDVEVGWRSVWVGALLTAVLFSIGKTL
ncbi:MAG TPA: ribonuclease BN, partial [Cryomorphaceae bacterium]|nr:ribonuclease BN [Cryomorphaceae bacterium]